MPELRSLGSYLEPRSLDFSLRSNERTVSILQSKTPDSSPLSSRQSSIDLKRQLPGMFLVRRKSRFGPERKSAMNSLKSSEADFESGSITERKTLLNYTLSTRVRIYTLPVNGNFEIMRRNQRVQINDEGMRHNG